MDCKMPSNFNKIVIKEIVINLQGVLDVACFKTVKR